MIAAPILVWIAAQFFKSDAASAEVTPLRMEILRTFHHDASAYTQGLVWHAGKLFESTGQYGHSTLRQVNPEDGNVERNTPLPDELFGEGLALVGDRFFQLTWREGQALVSRLEDFERLRTFRYTGDGWGLCYDGRRLVMTDGSDQLFFRDAETFERIGSVSVTLRGAPLSALNELECVGDQIYANVYQRDFIVRIDPRNGRVTGLLLAKDLITERERSQADVLNGIAYNPRSGTFYITGKLWPKMFEVRISEG